MIKNIEPNNNETISITLEGVQDNMDDAIEFVRKGIEVLAVSKKDRAQLSIAVDEIFSNIIKYAYDPQTGPATIKVTPIREDNVVEITFIDQGKPYNPLEKDDPDVTLPAEERGIGGLGIFIVRNSMDDVEYEYVDGNNILTLRKKCSME